MAMSRAGADATRYSHSFFRPYRGRPFRSLAAIAVITLATGWLAFAQNTSTSAYRYAVVIGNSAYTEIGRLRNPANDAHDVSVALTGLGFTVDSLEDADLPAMEGAIVRLGSRLAASKDAVGFFFFAGHGVQSNGINYLIPVDAHIPLESFLRTKALAVQEVLDVLQDSGNSLNIVVLDACRDNPFSWARAGTRGLTVVPAQPPGSIIVYATGVGGVAQDGPGRNGVFTSEMLKYLSIPGLEVKDVFNRTGASVQAATGQAQVPAVYSQFFGTAFLAGQPQSAASPGASAGGPALPGSDAVAEKKPVLTVPKAYGSITVEVRTTGTLFLDGTSIGQIQPGPPARLDNIEVGPVRLEMRYSGGKTETQTVVVKENAATAASFAYLPPLGVTENMLFVEGGTFQMGDTSGDGYRNEKPVHTVTISDFYVSRYLVTQKEWAALMGSNPSNFNGDNLPVESVSWLDAVSFCNKLSYVTGHQLCYVISGANVTCDFAKNGFRLPTEAEWEFAARGGLGSKGCRYAGGEDINELGWYSGNSSGMTHAVGHLQANELGLFDMTGDVWEWTWDVYSAYGPAAQNDPRGDVSGGERVLRGGSWNTAAGGARVSNRNRASPDFRDFTTGFRVVVSAF